MAGPQKQLHTALGLTRPAIQRHIRDDDGNCALWSLLPARTGENVTNSDTALLVMAPKPLAKST